MKALIDFISEYGKTPYEENSSAVPEDHVRSTILIVDDNSSILKTLTKLLSKKNYRVIFCSDPKEAMSHLDSQTEIGAILLDIKMPGINGLELFKSFSAHRPDIPVIFFSAYRNIEEISPDSNLQPYGYIEKGVWDDIDRLYTLIDNATKKMA